MAFGESFLKATDLIATIHDMHERKMYAKLVFYLEACESGSMFKVRERIGAAIYVCPKTFFLIKVNPRPISKVVNYAISVEPPKIHTLQLQGNLNILS